MGNFLDHLPACVLSWVCIPRHICIQGNQNDFLFIMVKAQLGWHQLTTEQMDAQAGTIVDFANRVQY